MKSASVVIGPRDFRCRYWAKIIRAGQPLPLPSECDGLNSIPGSYARKGDEELMSGDFLIDGEESHHRKMRGWDYHIAFVDSDGVLQWVSPTSDDKADVKAQGLSAHMLPGAGLTVRGYRLSEVN